MNKVSIIGFGSFSALMIKHLQKDFDILVYSRNPRGKDKAKLDFRFVDLEEALAQDVIILSLPAQFIGPFLEKNAGLINPQAIVVDVASVKERPVSDMLKLLPTTCQIVGTHPIFGPGSAKNGLKGLRIVICPVRCQDKTVDQIIKYLKRKKLTVLVKTPEDHDRAMAYVLGLTQYIGRALKQIDAHECEFTTRAYDDLMDMRRIQGNDSWDLFYSVMRMNRFAPEVTEKLKLAFAMLDKQLDTETTKQAN